MEQLIDMLALLKAAERSLTYFNHGKLFSKTWGQQWMKFRSKIRCELSGRVNYRTEIRGEVPRAANFRSKIQGVE